MSVPEHVPRVRAVTPAGPDTLTLTLEDGQAVTVTSGKGMALGPDGVLLTDYHHHGPVYRLPPALAWEVGARLNLWNNADERAWDVYLLSLPSISEVHEGEGVLTLAFTWGNGRQGVQQFSGQFGIEFGRYEPGEAFTRFPLTVTLQQGEGEALKVTAYRVDHTSAGYAALAALGWDAPLPALAGEA